MFTFPLTMMSSASSNPGGNSIIQSIQHGSITIGASATSGSTTISSVNTSKTVLLWGGQRTTQASGEPGDTTHGYLQLTNSTTVTASRRAADTTTLTISFTVIEFIPAAIQSIQYGSISIGSGITTNTATISSVITTNSACLFLGQTYDLNATNNSKEWGTVVLTNATTVTANRDVSGINTLVIYFVVVEWASGVLNSSTQQYSVANTASSTTGTTTISSVTTGQTALFFGGMSTTASGSDGKDFGSVVLTNATTITLSRTNTSLDTTTMKGTVVEFKAANITSLNRGTVVIGSGSTTGTATIPSVNTSKTALTFLGLNSSGVASRANYANLDLTNSTTITSTCEASSGHNIISSYEAVEFV